MELNLWEMFWDASIVVKLVVMILITCSVITWMIVREKRKAFKKLEQANNKFMENYRNSKNLNEIYGQLSEISFSPYGAMFENGYKELLKVNEKVGSDAYKEVLKHHFTEFGLGLIHRGLKKGVNEANDKFEKYQSILASIGSVSPYIGLFGTVWGIISSFTAIAGGDASLETVAPGIAEALIATAIGLLAAIPAVLFFNHYNTKIAEWNNNMDSFGQEFTNLIERSLVHRK